MKVLIKLGGTLLDTSETRCRLAREIAAVGKDGHQIVVVHGGGKQMTRFLSERGVESRFVNGLRVSTPEVIEAVLKVLAGSVNRELVASLVAAGANAASCLIFHRRPARVSRSDRRSRPELFGPGHRTPCRRASRSSGSPGSS